MRRVRWRDPVIHHSHLSSPRRQPAWRLSMTWLIQRCFQQFARQSTFRRTILTSALQALESRDFDLCGCMLLAPGYYRGLAYLQNKQPELAVHEFQQVIDRRLLSPTFSLYLVLSQLELGHAFQMLARFNQREQGLRASRIGLERCGSRLSAAPETPALSGTAHILKTTYWHQLADEARVTALEIVQAHSFVRRYMGRCAQAHSCSKSTP
jgi:hypothetical protein